MTEEPRYKMVVETAMLFEDNKPRFPFIRKVYIILLFQLAFLAGVLALVVYLEVLRSFLVRHDSVPYVAICILFVLLASIFNLNSLRQKSPANYICLKIYTVAVAAIVGDCAAAIENKIILISLAYTAVVLLAISFLATQGIIDVTTWKVVIYILIMVLVLLSIVLFLVRKKFLAYGVAAFGILVTALNLLYHTQLTLAKKYNFAFSPPEYIAAAIFLYFDLVFISIWAAVSQIIFMS